MASWAEFEAAAPELAERVRARLDAHVHKTLATLRRDGSPRISGTETKIVDGELWIGSMWQALKALDLQRDPRFALHSGSEDPRGLERRRQAGRRRRGDHRSRAGQGDQRRGGGSGPRHLFRLDLREVSTVGLDEERKALVIEVWTPDGGVRTMKR